MSFLIGLFTTTLGRTAAIAAVCFLAGVIACWHLTHLAPRKFEDAFKVTGVENGATIEVKAGLAGRKTRLVMLQGITAPGLNDTCGTQSRDNLAALTGATIRVETESRQLGTGTVVGQCFGSTNADLALAQLRAGLASCETAATKEQLAAQTEAQRAKRGLWTAGVPGSHWWHFSLPNQSFPKPVSEPQGKTPMFDLQTIGIGILILVAIVVLGWIVVYFAGTRLQGSVAGKAAVSVVDTTAEVAAYTALTAVRYMPGVVADQQAVTACEYLLSAVLKWPATPAAVATKS